MQKQRLNLVFVWLTPSFGAFFTITDKSVLVSKDNKKKEKDKMLQISGDNYPQNEYRIFADSMLFFAKNHFPTHHRQSIEYQRSVNLIGTWLFFESFSKVSESVND